MVVGKSKTFHVICTKELPCVLDAYQKGAAKIGLDVSKEVCKYRDPYLRLEQYSLLQKHGYDNPEIGTGDNGHYGLIQLRSGDFLDIYLFTCRIGDPELSFSIETPPSVKIGGYGLF